MDRRGVILDYFGSHFGAKNDLFLMSFFDIIFDTENEKQSMGSETLDEDNNQNQAFHLYP